jgi:RNA polymerase sigma factor (sigma-70 family)
MTSDLELLQNYADRNSEEAFAELVRRHLDLVYSAALRQVRSPQLAEEVAQSAFTDLARNAGKLKPDTILTAWLYQVARRTAIDVVRHESRRQLCEQIAVEMTNMNSNSSEWTQIEPLLDEAMDVLDEKDRAAILLRYFENKNLREVGESLGTSDDAAQKRVSRAVERLREFFTKRGGTVGASGLAVVISANAVQAAPVELAVTISTAAVLAGTTITTTATATATKAIAMTTLQKTLITATIATAVGTGIYEARQASTLRNQVQSLQQQQAPLAGQIRQLQQERADATKRLASLADELAKAKSNNLELMKLRGQMTQLRNETEIENDPAFQKARLWMAKELKLRQQFEEHPDQWIPEMKHLSSEEWLDQARKADLDTATGMRCALSNVRVAAAFNFANKISEALHAYMNAHNQQLPDSTSQLSAYFQPPVDGADAILSRYEMSNSEQQANPAYRGASIIQKTLVDHIDNAILIGEQTVSSVPPPHWPAVIPDELEPVVKSYEDANHRGFLTIYDLEPYATTPAEKEALNKVIKAATTYTAVAAP